MFGSVVLRLRWVNKNHKSQILFGSSPLLFSVCVQLGSQFCLAPLAHSAQLRSSSLCVRLRSTPACSAPLLFCSNTVAYPLFFLFSNFNLTNLFLCTLKFQSNESNFYLTNPFVATWTMDNVMHPRFFKSDFYALAS